MRREGEGCDDSNDKIHDGTRSLCERRNRENKTDDVCHRELGRKPSGRRGMERVGTVSVRRVDRTLKGATVPTLVHVRQDIDVNSE